MLRNYSEIQKKFNTVISFSQGMEVKTTDVLFEDWSRGKEDFYTLFGGQLILNLGKYQASMTKKEKTNRFDNFIFDVEPGPWMSTRRSNERMKLADFLKANREGFFENQVVYNYPTIDPRTNKEVIIKAGTKLLRAFRFFLEDENELRSLQDCASMVIQNEKASGELCLSIHPLDFLSTSETTYGWRSCHALDGEYRAGNLSYMADDATIVCYLKGKDDAPLPNFPLSVPWNSKKWRMLIYFSQDRKTIYFGRQYPYALSDDIMEVIVKEINKLFDGEVVFGEIKDCIKHCDVDERETYYLGSDGEEHYLCEKVADAGDGLHYNDLLYSSLYTPKYALASDDLTPLIVGSNVYCPFCGEDYIREGGDGTMGCSDCYFEEDPCYCDYCGDEWDEDDLSYVASTGEHVCPYCWENHYFYCTQCSDYYSDEEAHTVLDSDDILCSDCVTRFCCECQSCSGYFIDKESMVLNDETDEMYCPDCAKRIQIGSRDVKEDTSQFWDYVLPF